MTDSLNHDIVAIIIEENRPPHKMLSFEGTGFIIARNLLVTCWHCVSSPPSGGYHYAAIAETELGNWKVYPLRNIEQDRNGYDLATANLDLEPNLGLKLASGGGTTGTNVWTSGYPYYDVITLPEGGRGFLLKPWLLKGYISRSSFDPQNDQLPCYELDMPAPKGLSGAPIVKQSTTVIGKGSTDVLGVLYGVHDVATIEHFTQIDPNTGKREPEIQRLESFALAHDIETLKNLRGSATQGLPLADYIRCQ